MTPQEFKASILQLAIQGKLVEHFESEEAIVIHASFAGDTSDFFEIPDNWKWLSIKDVASVNTGLSFKKQDQRDSSNGSLRVLRGGNIGGDYKYHLYEDDVYVELEQFQAKYIQLLEGDIITPSVTSIEKICKTGYIDRELPKVTAGGFVYIIRCLDSSIIDPKYLMYFIASAFNKEQCKPNIHKSGQAFYNLKKSGFIEQPICVPPLAEQKRIVAKIEELLPLIDRYEQAWSKLEDFNKRFPVDMQKSILQMAIQGKLVPQVPEEGTGEELFQQIQAEKQRLIKAGTIKKEKPLPETTEDEVPLDIPDSWKWVYIGDLFQHNTGKALNSSDKSGSPMEYITTSNVYWNSFMLDKLKTMLFTEAEVDKCTVQKGDLLVLEGGDVGRAAIWNYDFPMRIQNHIHKLRPFGELCIEYFYHIFFLYKNAGMINGKGIGIKGLSSGALHNLLVPLPPLAEQKRIVAKLEEILPLCERLK